MKKVNHLIALAALVAVTMFTACEKNEISQSDYTIEGNEILSYDAIDEFLKLEEIAFSEALSKAQTLQDFEKIALNHRSTPTRSTERDNGELNLSNEEKEIYYKHIDDFADAIYSIINDIPEEADPTNEEIIASITSIRDVYIDKVNSLNLSPIIKNDLKKQIYYNNGAMSIIINNIDELYELASGDSESIQTRSWLKRLWKKIKGPLKCTLYTLAAISGSSSPLAGVGYALAGMCWYLLLPPPVP